MLSTAAAAAASRFAPPQHAASASASASASRLFDFPDWVHLNTVAHIGSCPDDATTAATETRDGSQIEVSFVVAVPPADTRCVICCPDLMALDQVEEPPHIIGSDGAFLLIRAIFPHRSFDVADFFVYRSGPGAPSLELVPRPYPVAHLSNNVGILSCGDHCLVVDPEWRFDADGQMSYHLHIFSSKTKSWSSKVAGLGCGMEAYCSWFEPTKVFTVEGGSMAWVDLRNGILLCDSVADDPQVRLIQLPPLMRINNEDFGAGFDGTMPCLDSIRDVTSRNGWFRFIEMGFPQLDAGTGQLNFQWTAAMFKRMIHSEEQWELCGTIDSTELSHFESCFPDFDLALSNMISLFPTLDLYNDYMVYVMAKMKGSDPRGWVLAVNTRNKKLKKILPFSEETLVLRRIYLQCDFTKHLSKVSPDDFLLNLDQSASRLQMSAEQAKRHVAEMDLSPRACSRQKRFHLEDAAEKVHRIVGTDISCCSNPNEFDAKAVVLLDHINRMSCERAEVYDEVLCKDPEDIPGEFFFSHDLHVWHRHLLVHTPKGIWRKHGGEDYAISQHKLGYVGLKVSFVYHKGKLKTNWIMNVYFRIHGNSYVKINEMQMCHLFQNNNYDPLPERLSNFCYFDKMEVDSGMVEPEALMEEPNAFIYSDGCFNERHSKYDDNGKGKGKNLRRSQVWEHFTKIIVNEPDAVVKASLAICHQCNRIFKGGGSYGTTHLRRHIKKCCSDQLKKTNIAVANTMSQGTLKADHQMS